LVSLAEERGYIYRGVKRRLMERVERVALMVEAWGWDGGVGTRLASGVRLSKATSSPFVALVKKGHDRIRVARL
jgi:hypothetical protein